MRFGFLLKVGLDGKMIIIIIQVIIVLQVGKIHRHMVKAQQIDLQYILVKQVV